MIVSYDYGNFDLIPCPVFVLEMNARVQPVYAAFNASAREVLGKPLSHYLGRTALDVYPETYGRTAYRHHCDVRDQGVPRTYQLDLPTGDITRTIRTTLQPHRDSKGKLTHIFGSFADVTKEYQAIEAQGQFDTMSSEMEQFVALAAHDLRAPMRNIAVIVDMLREDFVNQGDGKMELLNSLEDIAVKSMDLITDVLTHVETVAVAPDESVISFPALCHDISATLDPNRIHTITTSTATLRTDRNALQIALRNLIDNAIKHGGRESLHIDLDVRPGLSGLLDVTLTDNGKGFSHDALKVMNKGQIRAESGYGLFGVKRLISARGGTLVARNLAGGHGAVVRFSLPGAYLGGTVTKTRSARNLAKRTTASLFQRRFSA